jgi:hypothetical protein
MIDFILIKLGFIVSNSGLLHTTNKFSKLIAEMAVRDGSLQKKSENLYSTNKNITN